LSGFRTITASVSRRESSKSSNRRLGTELLPELLVAVVKRLVYRICLDPQLHRDFRRRQANPVAKVEHLPLVRELAEEGGEVIVGLPICLRVVIADGGDRAT
jgi:hypothetical protein